MSSSSTKNHGEVRVRSKLGPIRIELLDHQLNRHALGFGELSAKVPAGLYTLQYSAGTAHDEEILRVEPGRTVTREVDLPSGYRRRTRPELWLGLPVGAGQARRLRAALAHAGDGTAVEVRWRGQAR
jgi:hypothetical protein